ncbi:AAEL013418-PA [Aedes aegypti]|uniref:Odorant receptor n=2 Tax=Aedes aegypti TaxID=7159 RepID=A0A1S7UEH1_AEDAE|nr:AAEL013418-PA [Aedes aegypti]DAA80412.1 TPA_exp: odorant receptor 76 [Aedes aegypti]
MPAARVDCLPNCRSFSFLGHFRDPFAFQKLLDRCIGFIHWDTESAFTRVKILLLVFTGTYYTLSCLCLTRIDPAEVPLDHFFGMWFLVGGGCSCFSQWYVLAIERRHLAKVIGFLTNLQQNGIDHPTRVRQRSRIVLYSIVHWTTNVSQTAVWAVTLLFTSSIAHATSNSYLQMLAYIFFPLEIMLIGMTANVSQINTFTTLLVFAVEFEILGEDFRQALDKWNVVDMKTCVRRHQKLLEMVMLFRDKLKLYLLLSLQIYFFSITFCCVMLVIQLKTGDNQMFYTLINLTTALLCLLLFGLFCDYLDLKVAEISDQVFGSKWSERISRDRSMKRNLLMILMRSQKKIKFTCGDIYAMSIVTCMNVINMCYSAFTLLMNMVQD